MATAARTADLDKPYDRILSPVERTALDFIRKRAAAGLQVTRADIAMAIGSQNLWGGTVPGVLNRLEQEGLQPSPPASKEQLIRRVTFDLTGLPPTLPEIDAFLADESSGAYEKVVDRLLAS